MLSAMQIPPITTAFNTWTRSMAYAALSTSDDLYGKYLSVCYLVPNERARSWGSSGRNFCSMKKKTKAEKLILRIKHWTKETSNLPAFVSQTTGKPRFEQANSSRQEKNWLSCNTYSTKCDFFLWVVFLGRVCDKTNEWKTSTKSNQQQRGKKNPQQQK